MLDLVLKQKIAILYRDTINILDQRQKITILYNDTINILDLDLRLR